MQRVHRKGSRVLSECCKVGYSATLARAHVHHFICSENRGLPAFHSIPSLDSASEARLYPGSDDEATDPKTCLGSAAQENTQTQSDPARFFLLISSAIHRATHVPVLQCLTAIVINS